MLMTKDVFERDGHKSLRELSFAPFSPVTKEILEELDKKLMEVKISIA